MRVTLTSVPVDDQARAERFYTEVLGFQVKHDIPLGEHRWLTVVSSEDPEGTEVLLEPSEHPAVAAYRSALVDDGIPLAQFTVDDVHAEHERLTGLGVRFTQDPLDLGAVTSAVFDDTCGNLLQIVTPTS